MPDTTIHPALAHEFDNVARRLVHLGFDERVPERLKDNLRQAKASNKGVL